MNQQPLSNASATSAIADSSSSPDATEPALSSAAALSWASPEREAAFLAWLAAQPSTLGLNAHSAKLASADASFRRYLRIDSSQGPLIVMDAPPALEDVRPFLDIGQRLREAGLHVPKVLAQDERQGFLLLEDLGSRLYLKAFSSADSADVDRWMREALTALVQMQLHTRTEGLPSFDAAMLQREMDLFPQWCVEREFGITWTAAEQAQWQAVCQTLIDSALAQSTVFVHRDWMPRNLMICEPNPGVLDFQDAVQGPATYDMACLLRDAFWSWDDEAREIDWAVRWWQLARQAGLALPDDFGDVWRQIEWMGAQRHLKVAGIFCRLKHRDGKGHYAQDLPRFFNYLTKVAMRYRPLAGLLRLLEPMSERLDAPRVSTGYTF